MKTTTVTSLRGVLFALVALCVVPAIHAEGKDDSKEKKVPAYALKKYDANQDGVLDEGEKAAWQADVAKKKADAMAKRLEQFDANKDGKLDASEKAAEKAAKKEAAEKKKAEREAKKAEKEKKKAEKEKKKAAAEAGM